jgi:hypothetical protein
VAETLAMPVNERLRRVLDEDEAATEGELRTLAEQADGWARALKAQIQGSERRLRELHADPASPLADIAAELRRVETLRPELEELRALAIELEIRTRELRTRWLLRQAESTSLRDAPLTRAARDE